jgi:hypothetical protein
MPSRAAAVHELLKPGTAAEGFLTAAGGAKSSAYGVTRQDACGMQIIRTRFKGQTKRELHSRRDPQSTDHDPKESPGRAGASGHEKSP